jgi:hypothetical protein
MLNGTFIRRSAPTLYAARMKPRSLAIVLVLVVLVVSIAFGMRGRGHAFMHHLATSIHGH